MTKTKICTKCGGEYPATREFFCHEKRVKDGLEARCRKCKGEYGRVYMKTYSPPEQSKIKKREWDRKYRQTQRGKISHKKYYATIRGYLQRLLGHLRERCSGKSKNPRHKCYTQKGTKCLFKSLNDFYDYITNILQVDPRGLTIDRIDNNGHYEKGNIRFVTLGENLRNKGKKN